MKSSLRSKKSAIRMSCIKSVYEDLMKYLLTLKQFSGRSQCEDEERQRSFESLSIKERLNFVQICTVELNEAYIFLTDFLVRNKGILVDYVKSIESLIDFNSEFDKIVELKRTLLEESSPRFKGILLAILADLRNIIKELSDILKMSQEDTNRWVVILKSFSSRVKKRTYIYKNLEIPLGNAQKEIHDALIQQRTKISDCKDMISYTTGESNYFPGEDGNFVEDLLGSPNEDVERYLRQLVNENMARRDVCVEHLKICQRSLEEHLVELEKIKSFISEITLLNILFTKFRKTKIFDIFDNFQFHLKNYKDLSKIYSYKYFQSVIL